MDMTKARQRHPYLDFFDHWGTDLDVDCNRNFGEFINMYFSFDAPKVSVQGVVALSSHFAALCRELDFYDAIFYSLSIFKKKRQILFHFYTFLQ
jgi:hypothetical protein